MNTAKVQLKTTVPSFFKIDQISENKFTYACVFSNLLAAAMFQADLISLPVYCQFFADMREIIILSWIHHRISAENPSVVCTFTAVPFREGQALVVDLEFKDGEDQKVFIPSFTLLPTDTRNGNGMRSAGLSATTLESSPFQISNIITRIFHSGLRVSHVTLAGGFDALSMVEIIELTTAQIFLDLSSIASAMWEMFSSILFQRVPEDWSRFKAFYEGRATNDDDNDDDNADGDTRA
jgi:hypothetical protein